MGKFPVFAWLKTMTHTLTELNSTLYCYILYFYWVMLRLVIVFGLLIVGSPAKRLICVYKTWQFAFNIYALLCNYMQIRKYTIKCWIMHFYAWTKFTSELQFLNDASLQILTCLLLYANICFVLIHYERHTYMLTIIVQELSYTTYTVVQQRNYWFKFSD